MTRGSRSCSRCHHGGCTRHLALEEGAGGRRGYAFDYWSRDRSGLGCRLGNWLGCNVNWLDWFSGRLRDVLRRRFGRRSCLPDYRLGSGLYSRYRLHRLGHYIYRSFQRFPDLVELEFRRWRYGHHRPGNNAYLCSAGLVRYIGYGFQRCRLYQPGLLRGDGAQ